MLHFLQVREQYINRCVLAAVSWDVSLHAIRLQYLWSGRRYRGRGGAERPPSQFHLAVRGGPGWMLCHFPPYWLICIFISLPQRTKSCYRLFEHKLFICLFISCSVMSVCIVNASELNKRVQQIIHLTLLSSPFITFSLPNFCFPHLSCIGRPTKIFPQ